MTAGWATELAHPGRILWYFLVKIYHGWSRQYFGQGGVLYPISISIFSKISLVVESMISHIATRNIVSGGCDEVFSSGMASGVYCRGLPLLHLFVRLDPTTQEIVCGSEMHGLAIKPIAHVKLEVSHAQILAEPTCPIDVLFVVGEWYEFPHGFYVSAHAGFDTKLDRFPVGIFPILGEIFWHTINAESHEILLTQGITQLLPPVGCAITAVGGYGNPGTTPTESSHQIYEIGMVYGITVVTAELKRHRIDVNVNESHDSIDVNAVVVPVLWPLVYESGTGTPCTFQGADIGGFDMESSDLHLGYLKKNHPQGWLFSGAAWY